MKDANTAIILLEKRQERIIHHAYYILNFSLRCQYLFFTFIVWMMKIK